MPGSNCVRDQSSTCPTPTRSPRLPRSSSYGCAPCASSPTSSPACEHRQLELARQRANLTGPELDRAALESNTLVFDLARLQRDVATAARRFREARERLEAALTEDVPIEVENETTYAAELEAVRNGGFGPGRGSLRTLGGAQRQRGRRRPGRLLSDSQYVDPPRLPARKAGSLGGWRLDAERPRSSLHRSDADRPRGALSDPRRATCPRVHAACSRAANEGRLTSRQRCRRAENARRQTPQPGFEL